MNEMLLMILNDDDNDYRGLNVNNISNYSFLTQVNIDIWANITKLLLLKRKCLKYVEIMKTTLELQNYPFALESYVTRFNL